MIPTNLNDNISECWTFNEGSRIWEYTILEGINSAPNTISIEKSIDYFNSDSINTGLLVSPYLSDFSTNKKIKFWIAEQTNNNTSVVIGTMTNPADIKTFTPYQTILLDNIPFAGREFEVNFNNYVGNNNHIAFLIEGVVTINNDGKNFMLDDFKYLEINSCIEPLISKI